MTRGPRPGQGRPLGFLCAWLLADLEFAGESEDDHKAFKPSFEQRQLARAELAAMEGSEWLFRLERPRADNEAADEPELFL